MTRRALDRPATKPPKRGRTRAPAAAPLEFIGRHPVFRLEEFADAHPHLDDRGVASILQYHVRAGRLFNPRRRVYLRMAPPGELTVDAWLLGSRLTSDAVVAYDGALSYWGATGLGHHISITSKERVRYFCWNDVTYSTVANDPIRGFQADKAFRDGVPIRVWSPEQTIAGCLDRLDLGPGFEKLATWFFKHDFEPKKLLSASEGRSRIAQVRLGALMDLHPTLHTAFFVTDALLKSKPEQTTYLEPAKPSGGRYWLKWNTMMPPWMAKQFPNT